MSNMISEEGDMDRERVAQTLPRVRKFAEVPASPPHSDLRGRSQVTEAEGGHATRASPLSIPDSGLQSSGRGSTKSGPQMAEELL